MAANHRERVEAAADEDSALVHRRIVEGGLTLAVAYDDGEMALAAARLRDVPDDDVAWRTARLLAVYARAAALGRRGARLHLRLGREPGPGFYESVRPELELAADLMRLVTEALAALGRPPPIEGLRPTFSAT